MFHEIQQSVVWLLGLDAGELTIGHMAIRAVVVYVVALVMVRLGEKRFFGKSAAFDVILGIILGSVVSNAITGSAEFFPTLAAGMVLVLLHWLFAAAAFRSDWFGTLIKGRSRRLVEDGEILWDAMRQSNFSQKDLYGNLRLQMNTEDLQGIQSARLERSGDISFVKRETSVHVVEVDVTEGIQTIRIQFE